ncbi:hypothetical protein TIFTF001_033798 [Ficus carica]|uniref:Uncharacterized protein n=1 Tax=Ficus carica TaxID=3494 RepID=A0AA88DYU0_FICCA|nr:hypothetical protein TIFTF001_033798 [Ficus carica]
MTPPRAPKHCRRRRHRFRSAHHHQISGAVIHDFVGAQRERRFRAPSVVCLHHVCVRDLHRDSAISSLTTSPPDGSTCKTKTNIPDCDGKWAVAEDLLPEKKPRSGIEKKQNRRDLRGEMSCRSGWRAAPPPMVDLSHWERRKREGEEVFGQNEN